MTNNQSLLEELQEEMDHMGIDIFGVASARQYIEQFPELPSPERFIPNVQSIILLGQILEPSTMRTILYPELANCDCLHRQGSSVGGKHAVHPNKYFVTEELETIKIELTRIGRLVTRKLRKLGYNSMNMPVCKQDRFNLKPAFVHGPAMYLAGLGTEGLHHAMLTPEFGPRFYVTSVLTDCPLPYGKPLDEELCLHCLLCVRACPIGALHKDGRFDARACSEYGTCSTCHAVCPVGTLRPFTPKEVNRWLKEERTIWYPENDTSVCEE